MREKGERKKRTIEEKLKNNIEGYTYAKSLFFIYMESVLKKV